MSDGAKLPLTRVRASVSRPSSSRYLKNSKSFEIPRDPFSGKEILEVSGTGTSGASIVEVLPIREDDMILSGRERMSLTCPQTSGITASRISRTDVRRHGIICHFTFGAM